MQVLLDDGIVHLWRPRVTNGTPLYAFDLCAKVQVVPLKAQGAPRSLSSSDQNGLASAAQLQRRARKLN